MAKTKTTFFCQNCGTEYPKWMGQCKACGEWNTIVEELVKKGKDKAGWRAKATATSTAKPKPIKEVDLGAEQRINTAGNELNRVLGGGLVPGSVILLGGEPGIGKSTLMLQIALRMKKTRILYVSGEESEKQIRMRAERIGITNEECYLLPETSARNIFEQAEILAPHLLVIDSIQTLYSDVVESTPGSVSQIRQCTAELIRYAKDTGVPVFVIGHITKEGNLAGPKVLEHMVDVVLQFEGDRNYNYRLLRAHKNRFGSTQELGIYEMHGAGLREVANPSELLVSEKDGPTSGTAIAATLEGMRPMMIEIQALVSSAVYGNPQRSATGYDLRRLNMLLAVLEKRCGFKLGQKDVFLNITGGIKVVDPAIDLAVMVAVLSSNVDLALEDKVCFAAEVGLTGEIRPVQRIEQRIKEAEKLGFDKIFISKFNKVKAADFGIKVIQESKIERIFQQLFAG
ncbi:MAG: DNA repair protein RadA [Flavobacteriales bacterium]|nr:DNA repair protein RadA [Flavobacteriales bacterium]